MYQETNEMTPELEENFKFKIMERFWSKETQRHLITSCRGVTGPARYTKALEAAQDDMAGSSLLDNPNYVNYQTFAKRWLEDLIKEWVFQYPE